MPPRARVVTSNRQGNPPELRELSAGRYLVEPVQEEALVLTPEEAAGIEATLQSYLGVASSTRSALERSSTRPSGVEAYLHR